MHFTDEGDKSTYSSMARPTENIYLEMKTTKQQKKKENNYCNRNRTHMRKFRLFPFFLVCNNTPSVNHCYPISPNSPPLPHIHTHTHTQTFCLPVCLSFFSFSNNDNDIEFI